MSFPTGWSSFTFRIFIHKPVNEVFEAWTRSRNLEAWFFKSAKFVNSGGEGLSASESATKDCSYEFKWHGWDAVQKGKVIEVETNARFKFEFLPAGIVDIEYKSISESKTELILTQSEIPHGSEKEIKDFYYGCSLGWSFWMVNLKAWLEHGILLNEFDHPYTNPDLIYQLVNH